MPSGLRDLLGCMEEFLFQRMVLSLGFSESPDCQGINLYARTCKTNKEPVVSWVLRVTGSSRH